MVPMQRRTALDEAYNDFRIVFVTNFKRECKESELKKCDKLERTKSMRDCVN